MCDMTLKKLLQMRFIDKHKNIQENINTWSFIQHCQDVL